jgi:hypothetical protein
VSRSKAPNILNLRGLPSTLEELRDRLGELGDAAVAETKWRAISVWLMRMPADPDPAVLSNLVRVAGSATTLMAEHDRAQLGYPHHAGSKFSSPLPYLSEGSAAEARRVADETVAEWERAGRPHLDHARIASTFQYVHACLAEPADGVPA